jgi:hypothetical protein
MLITMRELMSVAEGYACWKAEANLRASQSRILERDPRLPEHRETASGVERPSKLLTTQAKTCAQYLPVGTPTPSCQRRQRSPKRKQQLGEPQRGETSQAGRWFTCLTQQQACVRYHAVHGRLSAHLLFGGSGAPKKFEVPRQDAQCRLQTPLAKAMMRAAVPTLVLSSLSWEKTCKGGLRVMQAALARSGGEHPTLLARYVEEAAYTRLACKSRFDRHLEVLVSCLISPSSSRRRKRSATTHYPFVQTPGTPPPSCDILFYLCAVYSGFCIYTVSFFHS